MFVDGRELRAGCRAVMVLAVISVAGCSFELLGGNSEPSEPIAPPPVLTAEDVTFDALGNARVLVRDVYSAWWVIDGAARTVSEFTGHAAYASLSPDGSTVAYMFPVSNSPVRHGLFVSRHDGTGRTRISGISRPTDSHVSWSPDGVWLYFVDGPSASVRRVRRAGGAAEFVFGYGPGADCPTIPSEEPVAVNAAGDVAFACQAAGIYVAGAQGTRLVFGSPSPTDVRVGSPVWSPDGTRLAFPVTDSTTWVRVIDAANGTAVASLRAPEAFIGTHNGRRLCWRANEGAFAFQADAALVVIDATGTEPATIVGRGTRQMTCASP